MFSEERKEEWFDYIAEEGVTIQLVRKDFIVRLADPIFRKEYIDLNKSINISVSDQEVCEAYGHEWLFWRCTDTSAGGRCFQDRPPGGRQTRLIGGDGITGITCESPNEMPC